MVQSIAVFGLGQSFNRFNSFFFFLKKGHFTGTVFHTGGAEAELLVGVWFGLVRHRVIDGGRRAVVFARAAVVEVPTSLRGRKKRIQAYSKFRMKYPKIQLGKETRTRQSESLGPVQPAAHCT